VLHDLDRATAVRIASELSGARVADTPRELAAASEIVITMLPGPSQVREAILGGDGIIEGLSAGGLVVDTSSSEPGITAAVAQTLVARDIALVDAPVSGGSGGAAEGTLTFMCGGTAEAIARCRPVLQAMGPNIFHVGGHGAGHAMKTVNNLCGALHMIGTTEALLIGKAFGLDPAVMADVLNVSTGRSYFTEIPLKEYVLTRSFAAGFKMDLMIKDVGIALGLADRLGVPVPLSALCGQLWRAARSELGPDQTVDDVARWLEKLAGVELRPEKKP
jgi:3-hydroxyisobutyrate dehydrogenase-like beta-hydroxyacid dehydrogenase